MNFRVLIAAALIAVMMRADALEPPPVGWSRMTGNGPENMPGVCDVGVDGDLATAGQPNMSIKCPGDQAAFAGLRQAFEASPYWGKRVRFSAWLMVEGVLDIGPYTSAGGLWIGVPSLDGPMYDRMPERALTGYTSWEYRDFVVDIPQGGQFINIGFWLAGQGQLWIRDLEFEVVPDSVPVNLIYEQDIKLGPSLDLE